jgi:hypothetical protein
LKTLLRFIAFTASFFKVFLPATPCLHECEDRMDHKNINRYVAGAVFVGSLATYLITLSPTVVFWDAGEFCAAAFFLQVPHPPGAPLFLLLARLSSLVPISADFAARMHAVSSVASALTCALLYSLTVRFIVMWRGLPATSTDRVLLYGSAVIGALSLAFSPTFWYNAVEAEVYNMSLLFISGILWIGLLWHERAETTRGDAYILLIAYLVGLAAGVHFLALLVLFPVMMLYYFRLYEFSLLSFVKFGLAALTVFGLVYPGIVKVFPSLLDEEFAGMRSSVITFIPLLLVGAALFGVYDSTRKRNRLRTIALLSLLLIILGYSTYTVIYIRANAGVPMNQGDPSTLTRFVSYVNREVYGDEPIMDRRWSAEPMNRPTALKYTSDFDFFWKYQFVHMYLRYIGWNYVGMEGDWKDAGVNWQQLYGIPLFLGLLGAFVHWRKDPRMAAVMTAAFLVLGLALVIQRNFQEPQVRERDYFYLGSYFVFSLWIGMGTLNAADWIRMKFRATAYPALAGYGALALAFVFVPTNMLRTNLHDANRKGNTFAWDYSYNVLQTCEQDAILFTNGDNDTYPLWYLQDVEGIRRDVRIVSLTFMNIPDYIKQLKHALPYGTPPVPISTSDDEIERLTRREFQPRTIGLPVPKEVMRRFGVEGNPKSSVDTISFTLSPTLEFGKARVIRPQDLMLLDIISTTNWQRPMYFAMTIPTESHIGLKDYLQLEGLAFRLTPKKTANPWSNVNEERTRQQLFTDIGASTRTPAHGYRWRGLQDSTTYFDEEVRHLMVNCRQAFILLARHYIDTPGTAAKAAETLDRMEQVLPHTVVEMDLRTRMYVAGLYNSAGSKSKAQQISSEIVSELKSEIALGVAGPLTGDNPYVLLLQTYETMEQFDEALRVVDLIHQKFAREKDIELVVEQTRAALLAERSKARQRDSLASTPPANR